MLKTEVVHAGYYTHLEDALQKLQNKKILHILPSQYQEQNGRMNVSEWYIVYEEPDANPFEDT